MAREKNVVILTFLPHSTYRLQPLDVTDMAPLSTYYEQEVKKWLFTHPERCVTIYDIATLFNTAFTRAAVMVTAINGFRKSGIYVQLILIYFPIILLPLLLQQINQCH